MCDLHIISRERIFSTRMEYGIAIKWLIKNQAHGNWLLCEIARCRRHRRLSNLHCEIIDRTELGR